MTNFNTHIFVGQMKLIIFKEVAAERIQILSLETNVIYGRLLNRWTSLCNRHFILISVGCLGSFFSLVYHRIKNDASNSSLVGWNDVYILCVA